MEKENGVCHTLYSEKQAGAHSASGTEKIWVGNRASCMAGKPRVTPSSSNSPFSFSAFFEEFRKLFSTTWLT